MAATTVTEFKAMPCSRCAGSGRIAQFQHRNGGECFRCGATGIDPVMQAIERDMTDAEVITALAQFGFDVIAFDEEPEGMMGLFLSDEQVARKASAAEGARMMLASI